MESATSISRLLREVYPRHGVFTDFVVHWRPYICPFHEIVDYVPDGKSSLDVGCGAGYMSVILAYLGKTKFADGFDTSSRMIDIARTVKPPKGVSFGFYHIEENGEWPDVNYDNILCIDVLHHIPRKKQRVFIKRLCRRYALSNIILKDLSPKPVWKRICSRLHDMLLSRAWVYLRDENEVIRWFEEEGFEVTTMKRMDRLCYSHYLIVAKKRSKALIYD